MRRTPTVVALLISIAGVGAPTLRAQPATAPVPAPATDPNAVVDPDQLRLESQQRLEADQQNFPLLSSNKQIEEIIDFDLDEGGMIVVRTGLAQTDGKSRIRIPSLPGFTTVQVQGKPQAGKDKLPRHFELMHYNFETPGAISVETQVFSSVGYMLIARTIEGFNEDCIVQFIQTRQPFGLDVMAGEEGVKLYVNVTNKQSDAKITDLNLSAANVVELRRLYPQETSQYLQPIFRDLGQDAAIFAADTRAAWQVFAPSITPDDATMRRIEEIVASFDSDDFQTREDAQRLLEQLGQTAAVTLAHFDRDGLSNEQNSRIDTFLAPYRPLSDEAAAQLRASPNFMLDCLINEDPEIRKLALESLQRLLDRSLAFDVNANPAARSEAVARLRAQLLSPATQPSERTPTSENR